MRKGPRLVTKVGTFVYSLIAVANATAISLAYEYSFNKIQ